jgi:hypothetical protein
MYFYLFGALGTFSPLRCHCSSWLSGANLRDRPGVFWLATEINEQELIVQEQSMISNFSLATQQTMLKCREHFFPKYQIKSSSLDQTKFEKPPRASPGVELID